MSTPINNLVKSISRTIKLTLSPDREWNIIAAEQKSTKTLYLQFAIPFIAFCSVFGAIGTGVHSQNIWFSISKFFVDLFALSIGLYCAGRILELLIPNFQITTQRNQIISLVIYSASIFCFFHGFAQIFTPYSFLNQLCLLIELYFIRILWIGTQSFFPIAANKRAGFVFLASLIILVLPLIFERMFSILFRFPVTI